MADVLSEVSADGHVKAMMRLERQADGSLMVEIDDGGPNTARIVLTADKAGTLGEIGIAVAVASSPLLNPGRVDARLSAAMAMGL